MKKLLIFALLLLSLKSYSQKFLKGYEYTLEENKFYPINYLRTYSHSDSLFTTTYSIYSPKGSVLLYTIIAMHRKSDKRIFVDVMNSNVSNYPINSEETEYDIPSLNPFGNNTRIHGIGEDKVPTILKVMFTSEKFENVKVLNINATEKGTTDFIWFVLDR